MPISVRVDPDHRLLYVAVQGRLSQDQLEAHQRRLEVHADEVRGLDELFDLTGCEGIDVTRREVEGIQRHAGRRRIRTAPGRLAVLAPTDLAYGLARMYEALAEHMQPPRDIAVVRKLGDALAWLDLPEGWQPPVDGEL